MKTIDFIKQKLNQPFSLWATYIVFYFIWGTCMNQFGIWVGVAKFTFWWQVITCYCLYMVPMSILMRDKSFFQQYVYGVVAIAPIEFLGYMNHTSIVLNVEQSGNTIINNGNLLAQIVDMKNFSLSMVIFFGIYFPLGNIMVAAVYKALNKIGIVKMQPARVTENIKD